MTNRFRRIRWTVLIAGAVFAVMYLFDLPSRSNLWVFWMFTTAAFLGMAIKRWQNLPPHNQSK